MIRTGRPARMLLGMLALSLASPAFAKPDPPPASAPERTLLKAKYDNPGLHYPRPATLKLRLDGAGHVEFLRELVRDARVGAFMDDRGKELRPQSAKIKAHKWRGYTTLEVSADANTVGRIQRMVRQRTNRASRSIDHSDWYYGAVNGVEAVERQNALDAQEGRTRP